MKQHLCVVASLLTAFTVKSEANHNYSYCLNNKPTIVLVEQKSQRTMKRNTAYAVSQPISGEIYDEVELSEYGRGHKKQIKQDIQAMPKKSSPKKSIIACLGSVFGVFIIILLLTVLIVSSVQLSAINILQCKLTIQVWRHYSTNLTIVHAVTCPELANPGNGTVAITSSKWIYLGLGSKASYSCDPGYKLVGDATRFCVLAFPDPSTQHLTTQGVWNGSIPTCSGML